MASKKLTHYAWYASLGSPRFVAAPMVDASELPFRLLAREFGAELCYTPMLHSRLLVEQPGYLETNFTTCAADRPLVAQLCGNDPATVLAAGRRLQHAVDAIDLNLGCPQGIAKRGHYGAFLLDEPDTIVAMVRALADGLSVPVTCKIRVLPTMEATLALARAIEAAGASLLTVHGRLRTNMKQSISSTDWEAIRAIKAALTIPVLANGSMATLQDGLACLAYTGADGIMLSEALLENPGLFTSGRPVRGPLCGPQPASTPEAGRAPLDQFALTFRYLQLAQDTAMTDLGMAKGHTFKQLYGVWRVFPDLMEKLAGRSYSLADVLTTVREAEARYKAVYSPVLFAAAAAAAAAAVSEGSGAAATAAQASPAASAAAAAASTGSAAPAPLPPYKASLQEALAQASALLAQQRTAEPRLAWCEPYYLVDPAQPGAWYMRHRGGDEGAYEGAKPPHVHGAPNGQLRGPDLGKFKAPRRLLVPGEGEEKEGEGSSSDSGAAAAAAAAAAAPLTLQQRLAAFKAEKASVELLAQQELTAQLRAAAGAEGSSEQAPPPDLWGDKEDNW